MKSTLLLSVQRIVCNLYPILKRCRKVLYNHSFICVFDHLLYKSWVAFSEKELRELGIKQQLF